MCIRDSRKPIAPNCYSYEDDEYSYIGIPENVMSDYGDRIVLAEGDVTIAPGVYLIPHKTAGLEQIGIRENMFLKTKYGYKPDDFAHEQSLVIETSKGLVIFNSCSHGGTMNILREVEETFPEKNIYALKMCIRDRCMCGKARKQSGFLQIRNS